VRFRTIQAPTAISRAHSVVLGVLKYKSWESREAERATVSCLRGSSRYRKPRRVIQFLGVRNPLPYESRYRTKAATVRNPLPYEIRYRTKSATVSACLAGQGLRSARLSRASTWRRCNSGGWSRVCGRAWRDRSGAWPALKSYRIARAGSVVGGTSLGGDERGRQPWPTIDTGHGVSPYMEALPSGRT
jgi:hypothetical protein